MNHPRDPSGHLQRLRAIFELEAAEALVSALDRGEALAANRSFRQFAEEQLHAARQQAARLVRQDEQPSTS